MTPKSTKSDLIGPRYKPLKPKIQRGDFWNKNFFIQIIPHSKELDELSRMRPKSP
uniref:Uncharacterized protein n=1 Tax=Meloidogyne enterolobii TaxID=390850 RepID=A0A6V7XWT3_MELEN|nr:unnamed protein product [Meloidogyne enterolobii]